MDHDDQVEEIAADLETFEEALLIDLDDQLVELIAALITPEQSEPFLTRLFSFDPGMWIGVAAVCAEHPALVDEVARIEERLRGTLRVTWLDYASSLHGPGHCTIIFFVEEVMWSSIALVERRDVRGE